MMPRVAARLMLHSPWRTTVCLWLRAGEVDDRSPTTVVEAFGQVNRLAVAAATLAYYLLGALWFTPLFGAAWDRAVGFERPADYRFPMIYYVVPLITSLLVSSATALLIAALDVVDPTEALLLALVVGIGYAVAVSVTNAVTPTTPRPLVLGAVTGGYHLAGMLVVTAILVLWR